MQFTVKQIILYQKQIERIQKQQVDLQAISIGQAFSKHKPKGGETK